MKLLWFFLWRMTLLGLALGTALGGSYGAAFLTIGGLIERFSSTLPGQTPTGPVVIVLGAILLAIYGAAIGVFLGAPVGLVLGTLDGLVVAAFTLAAYRSPPVDERRYREEAGVVCAAAALLAFAADWWLHGFPDASAFVFWRLFPFDIERAEPTASGLWWLFPRWWPRWRCGGLAGT